MQKILIFTALLMLTMTAYAQQYNAQSMCKTMAGPNSVGDLSALPNFSSLTASNTSGPYYMKIYLHVVRRTDGTGGQTPENVEEALDILGADFKPQNIFFVWDCEIDYIDDTDQYNSIGNFWIYNYTPHVDGIDIYFFRDQNEPNPIDGGGAAQDFGSKAFWVMGNFYFPPYGSFVRSHITSHEMAHCLSLHHTWRTIGFPNQQLVNDQHNCNSTGDFICDTPVDPGWWWQMDYPECAWTESENDPTGVPYMPDGKNIMTYSHPDCMEYFTEGQGKRMRQFISVTPFLQACIIQPDLVAPTISSNTTWTTANTVNNGVFLIEGDLVIESGTTLTINAGVTVHFGVESSLIIKPNARLVLNGTLTSMGCRGFTWQGVKVWGSNVNQSQFPTNGVWAKGRIECKNGSLIENAKTGIELYGPTYTRAGGQITCNGTTIKNCTIGLDFAPYINFLPANPAQPKNYLAAISGTTFLVDDDYIHDESFDAFVKLVGVNNIPFSGCSFTNERTKVGSSIEDYGYGIFAQDAGFAIESLGVGPTYPPSSFINSKFIGLGYGIYTSRVLTNRPYTVQQADFEKCYIGIRNEIVSAGTILFNNFKMGELHSPKLVDDQIGIFFETAVPGFTCQENTFRNVGGNVESTIGIICKSLGTSNKTIRKNNFYGLTYGNLANGINAEITTQNIIRGLNYECNNNFDVLGYDFSVPDGEIKAIQGLLSGSQSQITLSSAGNRFSYTGIDFLNNGSAIEYFFNSNIQNDEPFNIAGNITKTIAPDNTCPTIYCAPPCKTKEERENIKTEFYGKREAFKVAKTNYDANPIEVNARQLAYYQKELDEAAYTVVVHEMYDSTNYNTETLLTWIENMGSLESDLWLSNENLGAGNALAAIEVLNAAINKYQLTDNDLKDIHNYQAIVSLLKGKSIHSLDEATLQSIRAYVEAEGFAEGWAKSILTHYGEHFPVEYIKKGKGSERSNEGSNTATVNQSEYVQAKPNPAKDFVDFSIALPTDVTDVSIRIFDVNGKQVKAQNGLTPLSTFTWNTEGSSVGVYFYHLITDGKVRQSGKILLNK
jgi:Secretion system C-terminal sorting domain